MKNHETSLRNDPPILSVITATRDIVVHGRAKMLSRCIKSVAKLKIPHEHIICDGFSKDGTIELISRHASSVDSLKVYSEPDGGVYEAFNKGVRLASGNWIYFLGSDDYISSTENMAEALDVATRSMVEMAISPVCRADGLCNFSGRQDCGNILIMLPYCHQGVLMKKTLIERLGGFDEQYRLAADYKLCLKAHLSNIACVFHDKPYAIFPIGGGLSSDVKAVRRERLEIAARLLGVPENRRNCLYKKQLLPFSTIFRMLTHINDIVRQGARYALARRVAGMLGMLDANGGPKPFFVRKPAIRSTSF